MAPLRRRLPDSGSTEEAGRALASVLRTGDLVALDGDLGAGKTTFVRGIGAGMNVDRDAVRSPTFVLHHVHTGSGTTLHHVDLYRLGASADLGFLDIDGLLAEGVVAVEWAALAASWPVAPTVRIRLDDDGDDGRVLTIDGAAPRRFAVALAMPGFEPKG